MRLIAALLPFGAPPYAEMRRCLRVRPPLRALPEPATEALREPYQASA